jgi:hypothetical protein
MGDNRVSTSRRTAQLSLAIAHRPRLVAPQLWYLAVAGAVAATSSTHAADAAKPTPPVMTPYIAPTSAAQLAAAAASAQRQVESDAARARCTVLLKSIVATSVPHDTIDDGDCGTLAPIELSSVGKNPQVEISPPVIVTCDLAVAIHDWIKTDIQPLARKHLGQPVARMETMSSYSCRNAYGRKMNKLSEHGRANAVDVRGFTTTSGQTAYVLEHWGLTSGEIRAASAAAEKEQAIRQAAAQAEAAANAQRLAAAKAKALPKTDNPGSSQNPIAGAKTIVDGLPNTGLAFGNGQKPINTDLGLNSSKLGGPKKSKAAAQPSPDVDAAWSKSANTNPTGPNTEGASDATAFFLRAVHNTACQRFATTLGPETNAAHRNHFHIDLAERKTAKHICE